MESDRTVPRVAAHAVRRLRPHVRPFTQGEDAAGGSGTNSQHTKTKRRKNLHAGKRSLFNKTVTFLIRGWVLLHSCVLITEEELAQYVPRTLIEKARKQTSAWREFAVDKAKNIEYKKAQNDYSWTPLEQKACPKGKHIRSLTAVTYNVQCLKDTHDEIYEAVFCPHVLCLTGTRAQAEPGYSVTKRVTKDYIQYRWGAPQRATKHSNAHTGISITLNRKIFRPDDIVEVLTPPTSIQGRGGGLRVKKRGDFDFLILGTYLPPAPSGLPDEFPTTDEVLAWSSSVFDRMPERTTPIWLSDSNAHFGPIKVGDQQITNEAIGPWGQSAQCNYNGRAKMDVLLQYGMSAINTFTKSGSGATYYDTDGGGHRVDYICLPTRLLNAVTQVQTLNNIGYQLQHAIKHTRTVDHVPLLVKFKFEHYFEPRPPEATWDTNIIRRALHDWQLRQPFLDKVTEWYLEEQTQQDLEPLRGPSDLSTPEAKEFRPEEWWAYLNTHIGKIAHSFYGSDRTYKQPWMQEEQKRALEERNKYRHSLRKSNLKAAALIALARPVLQAYQPLLLTCIMRTWKYRTVLPVEQGRGVRTHIQKLQKTFDKMKRQGRRRAAAEKGADLRRAIEHKDAAEVWKLCRALAHKAVGKRGRRFDDVLHEQPTLEEWAEHIAQEGKKGGWQAIPLDECTRSWEPLTRDDTDLTNELFTLVAVYNELRKMNRGRAVPKTSLPKEIWEMLLQGGVTPQWDNEAHGAAANEVLSLLRWCHTHQLGPDQWYRCEPVYLDKKNGKSKCKRIRVISKLDPMGKGFYRMIWKKQTAKHKRPNYAYGFIRRRRREMAIMIQRINKERAFKAGRPYAFSGHDIENGFPSPSHDSLQATVLRVAEPEEPLLTQRFTRTTVEMKGAQQRSKVFRIRCGTCQGDSIAPDKFTYNYEAPIEEWSDAIINTNGQPFMTTDPFTEQLVDTSITTFADDAGRSHMGFSNMDELKKQLTASDEGFDAGLDRVDMRQNADKKETTVRYNGKGSREKMREFFAEKKSQILGTPSRVVRYLGGWITTEINDSREETRRARIRLATAWHRMTGFWRSSNVGWGTKRTVFTALMTSVATTGRSAIVPNTGDQESLEKLRLKYARSFLRTRKYQGPPVIADSPPEEDSQDGSSIYWPYKPHDSIATDIRDQCARCRCEWTIRCECGCTQQLCLNHAKYSKDCGHFHCGKQNRCFSCDKPYDEYYYTQWPSLYPKLFSYNDGTTESERSFNSNTTLASVAPGGAPREAPLASQETQEEIPLVTAALKQDPVVTSIITNIQEGYFDDAEFFEDPNEVDWHDMEQPPETEGSEHSSDFSDCLEEAREPALHKIKLQWPEDIKAIHIYTDGSCPKNREAGYKPTAAGWAFTVIALDSQDREHVIQDVFGPVLTQIGPKFLGQSKGTNNSAELCAIAEAIHWIMCHRPPHSIAIAMKIPRVIFTDSQHAIDMLTNRSCPAKNRLLIRHILRLKSSAQRVPFHTFTMSKIEGHAGHMGNDRADALAALGAQGLATDGGRWTEHCSDIAVIEQSQWHDKFLQHYRKERPVRTVKRPPGLVRPEQVNMYVKKTINGHLGFTYMATKNGLLIKTVHPNSPAARVELRPGDCIVQVNNRIVDATLTDHTSLWTKRRSRLRIQPIAFSSPQQTVEPELPRQQTTHTIELCRPRRAFSSRHRPQPKWGIYWDKHPLGLQLREVTGESLASRAGLFKDDIITHLNGQLINNLSAQNIYDIYQQREIVMGIIRDYVDTTTEGNATQEWIQSRTHASPTTSPWQQEEPEYTAYGELQKRPEVSKAEQRRVDNEKAAQTPHIDHEWHDPDPNIGGGAWQSMSAKAIRKKLNMHTIESECLISRCNLWKVIFQDAEEYTQLRTALFGYYTWESSPTLTPDGMLTTYANSFARQCMQDLQTLLKGEFIGFYDPLLAGKLQRAQVIHLRRYETDNELKAQLKAQNTGDKDVKKSQDNINQSGEQREEGQDQAEQEGQTNFPCPLTFTDGTSCLKTFDTLQQLTCHMISKTHYARQIHSERVLANQCMFCNYIFSNKAGAEKHVRRSFAAGRCSLRPGGNALAGTFPIESPSIVQCNKCETVFDDLESYHTHTREDRQCWPITIPDLRKEAANKAEKRERRYQEQDDGFPDGATDGSRSGTGRGRSGRGRGRGRSQASTPPIGRSGDGRIGVIQRIGQCSPTGSQGEGQGRGRPRGRPRGSRGRGNGRERGRGRGATNVSSTEVQGPHDASIGQRSQHSSTAGAHDVDIHHQQQQQYSQSEQGCRSPVPRTNQRGSESRHGQSTSSHVQLLDHGNEVGSGRSHPTAGSRDDHTTVRGEVLHRFPHAGGSSQGSQMRQVEHRRQVQTDSGPHAGQSGDMCSATGVLGTRGVRDESGDQPQESTGEATRRVAAAESPDSQRTGRSRNHPGRMSLARTDGPPCGAVVEREPDNRQQSERDEDENTFPLTLDSGGNLLGASEAYIAGPETPPTNRSLHEWDPGPP